MLDHHYLFQKLKRINRNKFNNLIITLAIVSSSTLDKAFEHGQFIHIKVYGTQTVAPKFVITQELQKIPQWIN